ncbi:MAG TPA: metallopeptidase family protein [Afifellaceae bacterium]|nr:metallopeptidase family protein [Afifellaceae bacterium]
MQNRQNIVQERRAAGGWRAPSLEDFSAVAEAAFVGLPAAFRAMTGEITFAVAEFPDDEVLESLGAESPFDILGLFEGIGMAQGGAVAQTGTLPNRIWLYRRPILDYWAEHDESLEDIVTHVLVHEIGHHFGLSDDDMEAIEAAAD